MPNIDINGRSIHYVEHGTGPKTIMFSHGYLMRHQMFVAQIAALSDKYRVIAFDHRGHGKSDPCHDAFGIYDLVDDAAALIDTLVGGPVLFVGMSTGGFVGLRLLLRRPDLIDRLILIDTSAEAEDPVKLKRFNLLLFLVRFAGLRPLLGQIIPLMFGEAFRKDPAHRTENADWASYIGGLDRTSVRRFGRAIFDRDDVLDDLAKRRNPAPTLIIVGEDDVVTPPPRSEAMQDAIAHAKLVRIPASGHSSPVESPDAVTQAITEFLAS